MKITKKIIYFQNIPIPISWAALVTFCSLFISIVESVGNAVCLNKYKLATNYLQFYHSRITSHYLFFQNYAQRLCLNEVIIILFKIPITGVVVKWWPDLMIEFSPHSFTDGVVIEKCFFSTSLLLHCQRAWTFSPIPSFIPGKAHPSWGSVIRAMNWRLFINGPKRWFSILTYTIP